MNIPSGFLHFLQQTDWVGHCVLAILAIMSIGCWFFILSKLCDSVYSRRHAAHLWRQLQTGNLTSDVRGAASGDFSRMLQAGMVSYRQWQHALAYGNPATVVGDPLERALGQTLADCVVRHERGLTFLACVAAGAPFVGLFGTVMGIYHALVVIGSTGEAGLNQVAGPVGEALLMTACGLACAIPAVLAYNFFTRSNRTHLAEMERFAHELHSGLTLGLLKTEGV